MRTSAVGLAGLTIVPSSVFGKAAGQTAPSDKLNIAAVGIGGMGAANLSNMETENIVALCDVDWQYAKGTFDRYSKAKRYWDYRKMLDNSKFSKDKWPEAYELLLNCGGENHEGYIGLQDHGNNVWFRNIRVKEL